MKADVLLWRPLKGAGGEEEEDHVPKRVQYEVPQSKANSIFVRLTGDAALAAGVSSVIDW